MFDVQVIPPEFLTLLLCPNIAFIETTRPFDKTCVPVPAPSHATTALQVKLHEVVQVAFYCSFSVPGPDPGMFWGQLGSPLLFAA